MKLRSVFHQTHCQAAEMSQRVFKKTKWMCYLFVIQAGFLWHLTQSVNIRTPPNNPSTVEAQAKFFQDFFSVQLSPYKMEFGHVCEDPNTWEQRYEKKDFKNHRDMGKVRWGDKKGGYGEHYWDLNHAGHSGNQGHEDYNGDDGSYHESGNNSPYEDHSNNSPYDNDGYDSEKSDYEEIGRAKRAHNKGKLERKMYEEDSKTRKPHKTDDYNEEEPTSQKNNRKNNEQVQTEETSHIEEYSDENEGQNYEKPKRKQQQYKKEENPPTKEKNHLVLVVSQKDDSEKEQSQYVVKKQPELPQYVSYEDGAGVRQHEQPEISSIKMIPRLFLEPSTGHVVDRATGQAYVLQPITVNNYN